MDKQEANIKLDRIIETMNHVFTCIEERQKVGAYITKNEELLMPKDKIVYLFLSLLGEIVFKLEKYNPALLESHLENPNNAISYALLRDFSTAFSKLWEGAEPHDCVNWYDIDENDPELITLINSLQSGQTFDLASREVFDPKDNINLDNQG